MFLHRSLDTVADVLFPNLSTIRQTARSVPHSVGPCVLHPGPRCLCRGADLPLAMQESLR